MARWFVLFGNNRRPSINRLSGGHLIVKIVHLNDSHIECIMIIIHDEQVNIPGNCDSGTKASCDQLFC